MLRRDRAVDAAGAVAGLLVLAAGAGCTSYRVEYHDRPSFHRSMVAGDQPQQVTLDDGTVLVYRARDPAGGLRRNAPEGDRFRIREELEDGTVVLRALLPQHVLSNLLTCLRNREYELIWDQLLAEQTKRAYAAREQGSEEFEAFCESRRLDLAATLTRMLMGLSRQESFMENVGGGVVRFRFHPRVATEFRFKTIEVVSEGGGLRLLMIR